MQGPLYLILQYTVNFRVPGTRKRAKKKKSAYHYCYCYYYSCREEDRKGISWPQFSTNKKIPPKKLTNKKNAGTKRLSSTDPSHSRGTVVKIRTHDGTHISVPPMVTHHDLVLITTAIYMLPRSGIYSTGLKLVLIPYRAKNGASLMLEDEHAETVQEQICRQDAPQFWVDVGPLQQRLSLQGFRPGVVRLVAIPLPDGALNRCVE